MLRIHLVKASTFAAGLAATAMVGAIAASLAGVPGCQRSEKDKGESSDDKSNPSRALPPQSEEELGAPLAKVDDVVITVGEFQERINRQSPYIRARYTSLEQKRDFLDNLIRFEVLAKEAFRRGFDKNPDVVRTMKQVMIQKLMKDEFENKIKPDDITDEEMRQYYEQHQDEYNKPEEVRASAIILKSKAQANKVAKEALGDKGKTNKGFRELVSRYSDDEKTKIRGGDLRYFGRESKEIPEAVIRAAFDLKKTGDVTGPIDAGRGKHYIIKQTGKRKEVHKAFEDVKRQIQNRIYRDKRTQAQKDFITGLKAGAKIKVYDDNLGKVRVDTSASARPGHTHHRPPAFPGAPGNSSEPPRPPPKTKKPGPSPAQ
jgi:peptidyl-prolyl cis-trans isomerase C